MMDVPILMYHEVTDAGRIEALARRTQRGYILTREAFEAQLRFFVEEGFTTVDLPLLSAALAGQSTLPAKPLVITFDDGYEGNCLHALPLLAKYKMSATFFVVTNGVGEAEMMDWAMLRDLRSAGMAVESHTANHPLLSTLNASQTLAELADSKHRLEDELGSSVTYLSLPNGDCNPHYVHCAKATGYRGGCGSAFGFNDPSTDPFFLRRIAVKEELGFERLVRLLRRDPALLRSMRLKSRAKASLTSILGKRNYDRLYNFAYGVAEQDRRK